MEGRELLALGKFSWREKWVEVGAAEISLAEFKSNGFLSVFASPFLQIASQFSFKVETSLFLF